MIDFITKSVNSRTITAFFDTREAAHTATSSLVSLGVPRHQIQMTEGISDSDTAGTSDPSEMSFWESLKSIFLPAEDHHSYAEGLRRGGYLLSVEADEALYDRAVEVLDSDGAVDMEEREASWRSSGWAGYKADETGVPTTAQISPIAPRPTTLAPRRDSIPPLDDAAVFGQRDISHGRSRVRSYVYRAPADDPQDERADERFSSSATTGPIADHMDVIASDGIKVGTVDHLDGENIKLAKSTSLDGEHHYVPLAWLDHVDTHVHLNRTSSEVKRNW